MAIKDRNQPPTNSICVGTIATAHGVKGLVKVLPDCEDLSLLNHVTSPKITLKNSMGKYVLAAVDGVNEKDGADALRGTKLYIDKAHLPEIKDENTFYYEDLIGLKTVDETGAENGTVKAVLNFGAGELLEVRLNSGSEVLIPFADEYVPEISDTITIRNFEGLML